jgi:hypothetical protein
MTILQQRLRFDLLFWAFLLTVLSSVGAAQAKEPWSNLQERMAWVNLGLWDPANDRWGTQPTFVDETTTTPDQRSLLTGDDGRPKAGSVLRVTDRLQLVILGFRDSGERRNRESPADVMLSLNDYTPLWLESGARVRVEEIKQSTGSPARAVWARVTPVD